MSIEAMKQALEPCPFCGAGTTEIRENGKMWSGRGWSEPSSVSVFHWCEEIKGQPSRAIERVGKDLDSAVKAWNLRQAIEQAEKQEPVAWIDALKDAFFEGFTSVETYNDSRLNSPEEAWAKYKPPVIPPAASVQQEPMGRVVSANCEYATVQWLRQTSEVGGGDQKNSRSWPIAGDAVYTTPQPQRQWVGLTDEEVADLGRHELWIKQFIRIVEAKLKERNHVN